MMLVGLPVYHTLLFILVKEFFPEDFLFSQDLGSIS